MCSSLPECRPSRRKGSVRALELLPDWLGWVQGNRAPVDLVSPPADGPYLCWQRRSLASVAATEALRHGTLPVAATQTEKSL
jgi:hypothetical protein